MYALERHIRAAAEKYDQKYSTIKATNACFEMIKTILSNEDLITECMSNDNRYKYSINLTSSIDYSEFNPMDVDVDRLTGMVSNDFIVNDSNILESMAINIDCTDSLDPKLKLDMTVNLEFDNDDEEDE